MPLPARLRSLGNFGGKLVNHPAPLPIFATPSGNGATKLGNGETTLGNCVGQLPDVPTPSGNGVATLDNVVTQLVNAVATSGNGAKTLGNGPEQLIAFEACFRKWNSMYQNRTSAIGATSLKPAQIEIPSPVGAAYSVVAAVCDRRAFAHFAGHRPALQMMPLRAGHGAFTAARAKD